MVRLFSITPLYLQIGPLLTALSPRRLLWPLTLSSIEVDLQLVPMSMRGAQGRPVPKQRSACMGAAYIYRRRSDAYAWGRIGRLLRVLIPSKLPRGPCYSGLRGRWVGSPRSQNQKPPITIACLRNKTKEIGRGRGETEVDGHGVADLIANNYSGARAQL